MTDKLIAELRALITDDHIRGCQGRCYACTCGYDDKVHAILTRAADALEPSGDVVERVARAMAPIVFLPFERKIHGSPVNHRNAQGMWVEKAKAAIAAIGASHAE